MSTSLYRFYDANHRLLYVGITGAGWGRWLQHARDKDWWIEVAHSNVEHYPTRREALEAERETIITERPIYNITHNASVLKAPPLHHICDNCGHLIEDGDGSVRVSMDAVRHAAGKFPDDDPYDDIRYNHPDLLADQEPLDYATWAARIQTARWETLHEWCDPLFGAETYGVGVDQIGTFADALRWTAHICTKTWAEHTDWPVLIERWAAEGGSTWA